MPQGTCEICGNRLTGQQSKYCCKVCANKAHNQRMLGYYKPIRGRVPPLRDHLLCIDCGHEFSGGIRSQRCPECRKKRQREYWRESQMREKAGTIRRLGSAVICEYCGKVFTLTAGAQKYCPECAGVAVPENKRAHAREKQREYRANPEIRKALNAARRLSPDPRPSAARTQSPEGR